MNLTQELIEKIVNFVKKEPKTVQEVSLHIDKSWMTAESYIKYISQSTGLLQMKVFRAGTQGALKLVYFPTHEMLHTEAIKENLYEQIHFARKKQDFDFMDVYQFANDKKIDYNTDDVITLLDTAQEQVLIFSGNLSFLVSIKKQLTALLKRKVFIKVLCRINYGSLNNIKKLESLILQFAGLFEIRHCYQPLRGFVIDGKLVSFKGEEKIKEYKQGELDTDLTLYYRIWDDEWCSWLQKVFWQIWKVSNDAQLRIENLK